MLFQTYVFSFLYELSLLLYFFEIFVLGQLYITQS